MDHGYWWYFRRELARVDWQRELVIMAALLAVSAALWWLFG